MKGDDHGQGPEEIEPRDAQTEAVEGVGAAGGPVVPRGGPEPAEHISRAETNRPMTLAAWFPSTTISPAEVRAEIWRLGCRHRGDPLQGALKELNAKDIPARQAMVLRACVRKLQES